MSVSKACQSRVSLLCLHVGLSNEDPNILNVLHVYSGTTRRSSILTDKISFFLIPRAACLSALVTEI